MNISEELVEDICHFVGTNYDDADERKLVKNLIATAYSDLQNVTGVNWLESETEKYNIALEVVRCKVYLSYYGRRDDLKNTASLERAIAAKTFSLQFSKEADDIRRATNGN